MGGNSRELSLQTPSSCVSFHTGTAVQVSNNQVRFFIKESLGNWQIIFSSPFLLPQKLSILLLQTQRKDYISVFFLMVRMLRTFLSVFVPDPPTKWQMTGSTVSHMADQALQTDTRAGQKCLGFSADNQLTIIYSQCIQDSYCPDRPFQCSITFYVLESFFSLDTFFVDYSKISLLTCSQQ